MSASSSSAQAVLQNPSSKPVLQQPPVIHIVMYNPGIHRTQVQNKKLYTKWIIGKLKEDVTAAILEHDADDIMLCELGNIEDGLGPTLIKWKTTHCAAKPGDCHLVEEMLLELVSYPDVIKKHPSGWLAHAANQTQFASSMNHTKLAP